MRGLSRYLGGGVAIAIVVGLALPSGVGATAPSWFPSLWQVPEDGAFGAGAGRLNSPRGLAAAPETAATEAAGTDGHIYVAESTNERIDEFTAWGVFVRAFGWGVRDGAGEAQVCTTAIGCQAGIAGPGAGQIRIPNGVAVDGEGDVYVFERENHRVQKFDPEGHFLLTFGGEVDKTSGANVCTAADLEAGDECGKGVLGAANGFFNSAAVGNYLAVGPDGETVYVGDENRIQEFDPNGTYNGEIDFSSVHAELASFPAEATTVALAADPSSGDLYLAVSVKEGFKEVVKEGVWRLSAAGAPQGANPVAATVEGKSHPHAPRALAVDSEGDLLVVDGGYKLFGAEQQVLEFDPAGAKLVPSEEEEEEHEAAQKKKEEGKAYDPFELERFGAPEDGTGLNGLATSAACEVASDALYLTHFSSGALSYARAYGPPPANEGKCPPGLPEPPQIKAQYALAAGSEDAELGAKINPRLQPGTRYYLQYGTGRCSEGGCGQSKPAPPGALLSGEKTSETLSTPAVILTGLAPATAYHYRFVAQSSGGGPIYGAGGEEGIEGEEGAFTTFPPPAKPKQDCDNQAYRIGPAAHLPDCRAYEMVSPLDKNGGDIATLFSARGEPAQLNQAAVGGDKLAYSSKTAFGDAAAAPWTSEYIAARHAGEGWSTQAIDPARPIPPGKSEPREARVDVHYKAFSADLCSGWVLPTPADPTLAPGAVAGFLNLYRRDDCGGGGYEAITVAEPQNGDPERFWPALQGLSADDSRAVFAANAKLTAGASSVEVSGEPIYQVYERSASGLGLVSVLPGGEASDQASSAGSANGDAISTGEGRINSVAGAVSTDGERVYWSDASGLYLREHAGREQSEVAGAECTEAAKACTYPVAGGGARFWAASADGAKAIYASGGGLYEFDAEEPGEPPAQIAAQVPGVVGASEDLSRVYFVSTEDLGGEAQAGAPNLYLDAEGAIAFVKTLASADLSPNLPFAALSAEPTKLASHLSPDGRYLAFTSAAKPAGYDNTDAASGQAAVEVYLYAAAANGGEGSLACVSCDPSGARPSARRVQGVNNAVARVAAVLPTWQNQLHAPRALAADGQRLFFDSYEALVPRDANGREDVYQWEPGASQAGCEASQGAELYVAASGGCLSLISSGQSAQDSEFVDADPAGHDAFFRTGASLVPSDPGLLDIYDARVGGGFPQAEPASECEGEACQSPAAAPEGPTPASAAFQGPGNLAPKQVRRRCPKGKRRVRRAGKVRCLGRHRPKRHRNHHKRRRRHQGRGRR